MYLLSIPPDEELERKLVRWLKTVVPGVQNAMIHRPSSGLIYVEAWHYANLANGIAF